MKNYRLSLAALAIAVMPGLAAAEAVAVGMSMTLSPAAGSGMSLPGGIEINGVAPDQLSFAAAVGSDSATASTWVDANGRTFATATATGANVTDIGFTIDGDDSLDIAALDAFAPYTSRVGNSR